MQRTDPYENDPKYTKYFKMIKMHLPPGAVRVKMTAEGHDPAIVEEIMRILESDPSPGPGPDVSAGPKLKDDARFKKYFKFIDMHVPKGAIAPKMMADSMTKQLERGSATSAGASALAK